jgi:hypothetical protein
VTLIADVIPRERCYASDFKCAAPGEDEAAMFDELAKLAGVAARVIPQQPAEMFRSGFVTLAIEIAGRLELLALRHVPYYVPPSAMLELLNRELERADREHRLVACRDDVTDAVVMATPAELMQLESVGLVVA